MKNILKTTIGLLIGAGLFVPTIAQAGDFSLKLEPGIAVPVYKPQSDRFDVGGDLTVRGLYWVTPSLGIGPSLGVTALPSDVPGVSAGTAWKLGGGLVLQRPHDASNTGSGFSAVSPWFGGDMLYVYTGAQNRFGWALSVGAAVPTSDARTLWIGPFLKYQDVVQGEHTGTDNSDSHVFIAGLSFEFDAAQKKVVQIISKTVSTDGDRDGDGVLDKSDKCPDVPGPVENYGCPKKVEVVTPPPVVVAPPETKIELKQRIQFAWDSPKIESTEFPALNQVTKTLLDCKKCRVKIEGHASSEGDVEHNNVLAQQRADAVLNYLASQGVPTENLTATGFGSSVPIASNDTEEGRIENRRVEFVVSFVIVKDGE